MRAAGLRAADLGHSHDARHFEALALVGNIRIARRNAIQEPVELRLRCE